MEVGKNEQLNTELRPELFPYVLLKQTVVNATISSHWYRSLLFVEKNIVLKVLKIQ